MDLFLFFEFKNMRRGIGWSNCVTSKTKKWNQEFSGPDQNSVCDRPRKEMIFTEINSD